MKIVSDKRKIRVANRHFFEESGIRNNKKQTQHPYLVVKKLKTRVNLNLVYTAAELLTYPNTTKVLAQWQGKNRSDFYCFKVMDLRKHIIEHPPKATQKI
jgi:hypothetical protein